MTNYKLYVGSGVVHQLPAFEFDSGSQVYSEAL
jgi:hypothetical protein